MKATPALPGGQSKCTCCERTIERRSKGRQRRYCSNACRQRALRKRFERYEIPNHPEVGDTLGRATKSSVRGVPGPKQRPPETANDYPNVVAMIDAKTRVIECAAGLQWIVQRREGRGWRSENFCRTKEGLLLFAKATPEITALPDHIDDGWVDWPASEVAS